MKLSALLISTTLLIPVADLPSADRLERYEIQDPDFYVRGNCESLAKVFRHYGMTDEEYSFFFKRGILWRESQCGIDTYNERTGDTGVCQLTHWHSKPGYYNGTYYSNGWATELFELLVGKYWGGIHRDHSNIIPACLWLLRGGNFEPGIVDTDPWNIENWT